MKRYLIPFLIVQIIFLAGCSLPVGKDISVTPAVETTRENTSDESSVKAVDTAETSTIDNKKSEAVQSEASTGRIPVTLYYQDAEGFLIPLTRWIDKQQGIAKAAVNGLIDSAITREEIQYYGVYPVLPVNSDVLGINIKEGIAVIDFNKKLLDYKDVSSEKNVIASVVYTLTSFSTINGVKILINGYTQKTLKYGTDVSGVLNRGNVLINPLNTGLINGTAKADIYFFRRANEGFTYLLPVSVEYGKTVEEITPETMVRLLLKEKATEKLQSEMPIGAGLIDCTTKDGVFTLNFNTKFTEYGGNAKEEGILKQLLYTVKQANGINKVRILIDGKTAVLPEGTDTSAGLVVPKTINDVIDR